MLCNVPWGRLSFGVLLLGVMAVPLFATSVAGAVPAGVPTESEAQCTSSGCGNYGTSVRLYDDVQAAAKLAAKESKLLFVVHLSGNFQKEAFT